MRRLVLVLVVVASGCGVVNANPDLSNLPDGGDVDGMVPVDTPDAMPDTMPEPVKVRVIMNDVPTEGVDIVFHDGTGAPLMTTKSDVMGRAELLMPSGGMVTVLGPNRVAHTIMGAEAGDTLTFRDVGYLRGGDAGQSTLTFPSSNPANTTTKLIVSGCFPSTNGVAQATYPVFIGPECGISPSGDLSIMAVALDATGNATGFTVLTTMPFSAPSFTLPAYTGWSSPATNGVYGISGIPTEIESGRTQPEIFAGAHRLVFPDYSHDLSSATSLTSHTFVFAGIGDTFVDRVRMHWPYQNDTGSTPEMWIVARGAAPLSGTLAYANLGLPELVYPPLDLFDVARPRIATVLPSGSGAADVDGGMVDIDWLANTNQDQARWTISFPPGQTEVRFPELPTAFSDRRPTNAVDVIHLQGISFADIGAGGQAAFRALAQPWHPETVLPPANGMWRITRHRGGD
jgi:hypothetical protein